MSSESHAPPNSLPSLLRDLRDETSTLLRQEVALAKAELKENTSRLTKHAVKIAVGGFVAYAGAIVLLIGLGHLLGVLLENFGLSEGVAQWLAPTLVGLAVVIVGWVMLSGAKRALAHDQIAPRQTVESLRANKEWVRGKLHSSP